MIGERAQRQRPGAGRQGSRIALTMALLLGSIPTAASAETLALTSDRVAIGTSRDVRVYGVADGALIASIPFDVSLLEWRGETLILRSSAAFASWTQAGGLRVTAAPRGVTNAWVSPDELLYAIDAGVRVVDPWTGLSQTVWTGQVESAASDGFVDAQGLHGWDGALLASYPEDRARTCDALPGPAMVCTTSSTLTVVTPISAGPTAPAEPPGRSGLAGSPSTSLSGEHATPPEPPAAAVTTWRSPKGTSLIGGLAQGPAAGTMLVRDPGASGFVRLISPSSTELASWPYDHGNWLIAEAGLVHYAADTLIVYGLDGQERQRISAPAASLPMLPVPEPAVLVRQRGQTGLYAADDGAALAQAGGLPREVSVHDGLATFAPSVAAPRFRSFNENTWVYEADGTSTTATIRRPGVQGMICGDTLALVTTGGALEAYSQKGVKRWALAGGGVPTTPIESGPRLVGCVDDAWLVRGEGAWALVDGDKGKVLARGEGDAAATLLPTAVVLDKTGGVTLRSGSTYTLGVGWKARSTLPGVGGLPEAVLATRAGIYARIDSTGIRWEVRLGNGPVIVDGGVVYAAAQGALVALDGATGELTWASPLAESQVDSVEVLR